MVVTSIFSGVFLLVFMIFGYINFIKYMGIYSCKEKIIYSTNASSSITKNSMLNSGPKGTSLCFTETSIHITYPSYLLIPVTIIIPFDKIDYISYTTTIIFSFEVSQIHLIHNIPEYEHKYDLSFGDVDIFKLKAALEGKVEFVERN